MAKILSQCVTHLTQIQITHLPQMQAAVKKFSIAVDNLLDTSKFQKPSPQQTKNFSRQ